MKLTAILAVFIFATVPFAGAHIEPGTYIGTTPSGTSCQMEVVRQYYLNDTHHPLNERVEVRVVDQIFQVGHPPVIDVATSRAFFNHDAFHGILATPTGAVALVIPMIHEEGREGPAGFDLISNVWRGDVRTAVHCRDLTHVPTVTSQEK